jgi:hypothetical protein
MMQFSCRQEGIAKTAADCNLPQQADAIRRSTEVRQFVMATHKAGPAIRNAAMPS